MIRTSAPSLSSPLLSGVSSGSSPLPVRAVSPAKSGVQTPAIEGLPDASQIGGDATFAGLLDQALPIPGNPALPDEGLETSGTPLRTENTPPFAIPVPGGAQQVAPLQPKLPVTLADSDLSQGDDPDLSQPLTNRDRAMTMRGTDAVALNGGKNGKILPPATQKAATRDAVEDAPDDMPVAQVDTVSTEATAVAASVFVAPPTHSGAVRNSPVVATVSSSSTSATDPRILATATPGASPRANPEQDATLPDPALTRAPAAVQIDAVRVASRDAGQPNMAPSRTEPGTTARPGFQAPASVPASAPAQAPSSIVGMEVTQVQFVRPEAVDGARAGAPAGIEAPPAPLTSTASLLAFANPAEPSRTDARQTPTAMRMPVGKGDAVQARTNEPATSAGLLEADIASASTALSASIAPTSPLPLAKADATGSVIDAPLDFDTLVQRLDEARQAASPQIVRTALVHADFGRVTLNMRHEDQGLKVTMNSLDPSFAPAVQAALTAVDARDASAGGNGSQTRNGHDPRTTPDQNGASNAAQWAGSGQSDLHGNGQQPGQGTPQQRTSPGDMRPAANGDTSTIFAPLADTPSTSAPVPRGSASGLFV